MPIQVRHARVLLFAGKLSVLTSPSKDDCNANYEKIATKDFDGSCLLLSLKAENSREPNRDVCIKRVLHSIFSRTVTDC